MELTETDVGLLREQRYSVLHKVFSAKTNTSTLQFADISNAIPSTIQNKNGKTKYVIARCRNLGEMDRADTSKSTDFSDVNGSLTNYTDNAILDTQKCNVQTPAVAGVSRANKGGKGNTSACNCIKWTNNPADTMLTKNKTTRREG